MRCFVALDVSDVTRVLVSHIRGSITEIDPAWRTEKWVALENLHVTVVFLGEVKYEEVRTLVASLRVNSIAPFTIGAPTLVAVPDLLRSSMIWLEYLGGSSECSLLEAFVRQRACELGILPDARGRRFSPHVTLARSRSARAISDEAFSAARAVLDAAPETSVSVSSVRVFSSSLGRVGPTYTLIAEVPLAGPPGG